MGNYTFTPLYSLRRPIKRIRRWIRDTIRPEPSGDDLLVYPFYATVRLLTNTPSCVHARWHNDSPPWDPLDEEGEEDEFDPVSVGSGVSFVVGFS